MIVFDAFLSLKGAFKAMFRSKLMQSVHKAFLPPFNGMGVLVWVAFVWVFLMDPSSALLAGSFIDSDDYIHLVRVIEWLQGQSWFDPVLHRLAPPEGVAIHYSRIAELPLAAFIWPLHAVGLDWLSAAYVAAALYPLILLGCFLVALRWLAEPAIGDLWARVSAFVAVFTASVTFQFLPGRVDHHGLAVIVIVLALGAVLRLTQTPSNLKVAALAGGLLAFGQSIAMETLPWMILFSLWVGGWLIIKGRVFATAAIVYGLTLYVLSALLLFLAVPFADYYSLNPLSFSYLYVLLSGLIALVFLLTGLASFIGGFAVRAGVGAVLSCFLAAAFWLHFPALRVGPYGGMDREMADFFFVHISEAVPLARQAPSYGYLLALLSLPLTGAVASLVAMTRAEGQKIWQWLFFFVLILVALLLALSYQRRVILYACLFSLVPVAELLRSGWAYAAERWKGSRQLLVKAAFVALAGPLQMLLVFVLANQSGLSLVSQQTPEIKVRQGVALWQMLTLPEYYGDRPRLIMNTINEGAPILFHSAHSVMAAPYHTNVQGNRDAMKFFRASTSEEARALLKRTGAELVLMPSLLPSLYRSGLLPAEQIDGQHDETKVVTFARQLVEGSIPAWLKPIEMPFMGDMLLFEVKKDLL